MNSKATPLELSISVAGVCAISLECWRLNRIADSVKDSSEAVALRHAARRITEALNAMGVEIFDFAGRMYDPGLLPQVAEVRQDEGLPDGHAVIEETIAPTVTWRGHVFRAGQIIVKRAPAKA
jgi:hypothetical protein